jgi:hypothetical protein
MIEAGHNGVLRVSVEVGDASAGNAAKPWHTGTD